MAKRLPAAMRPSGLGPRGKAVWSRYAPTDGGDIGRALLATEAARLADRLDQLHALISGDVDTWAKVRLPQSESEMTLQIGSAVTEARQSANVLRQIVAKLDGVAVAGGEGAQAPAAAGRSVVESIVARHADGGSGARAS